MTPWVWWVLYSEVVISDHVPGPLLCHRLKLAERQPEQQHSRGLQSQLTRMGFIIIQHFWLFVAATMYCACMSQQEYTWRAGDWKTSLTHFWEWNFDLLRFKKFFWLAFKNDEIEKKNAASKCQMYLLKRRHFKHLRVFSNLSKET